MPSAGTRKATIREIVTRANANLNAVNYYFRDKRNLYYAVFEHAHERASEGDERLAQREENLPPAERLGLQIRHILRRALLMNRTTWPHRLLVRELTEPTGALEVLVDRVIRPRFEALAEVVRALLPEGTEEKHVRLCTESIVAQFVHVAHAGPVVSRLLPEIEYTPEGLDEIADHITRFSLAALKHLPAEEATK